MNTLNFIMQIAGGSGITPMLQVIEAILKNSDDKTQVGCKPLHYIPQYVHYISLSFFFLNYVMR